MQKRTATQLSNGRQNLQQIECAKPGINKSPAQTFVFESAENRDRIKETRYVYLIDLEKIDA